MFSISQQEERHLLKPLSFQWLVSKEGENQNGSPSPKNKVFHCIYYCGCWYFSTWLITFSKLYISGFPIPCPLKHVPFAISWVAHNGILNCKIAKCSLTCIDTCCSSFSGCLCLCSRMSCKWNHSLCNLSRMVMFTKYSTAHINFFPNVNGIFFCMSQQASVLIHQDY